MECSVSYTRNIPVRYEVDVFIAGGGPAGIAAAVTAARSGSKVFLAEAQSCLGGMGTLGLIPAFCMFGDGVNFLAYGIGKEIFDRMNRNRSEEMKKHERCIEFEPLKLLYDKMMQESGADFTFMTNVVDVIHTDGHIEAVICSSKSGMFAVKAGIYIDCTGDGDMSVMAGAKYEMGDDRGVCMPGTLCSMWSNVDWAKYKAALAIRPAIFNEWLYKAFDDGVFTVKDLHHPGMWRIGDNATGGNFGHGFGVDGTDERSLTKALLDGRAAMPEFRRYYREYVPGFENAELMGTAPLYGIRESRRITGDYILGEQDFLERASFDDEIGRYCYPIDMHPATPDPELFDKFREEFLKKYKYGRGESYGIPYRSLISAKNDNLLVAGRCVSCDQKMQGSIRVMPGCFITGQAAGMAAAIASAEKTDARGFDVNKLLEKLEKLK